MLQAIDALALDYTVKFPLSLVISRKTILRYQLLFRFLLHLKHVEQSLSTMWIEQKTAPWRTPMPNHPELERWRLRVFLLRARMLSFVQQILAFATFEVLEPNWRALEGKLAKVTTVDQLLRDHVDFLDTCLKECMLTSSKLLRVRLRYIVKWIIPDRLTGVLTAHCDVFDVRVVHLVVHQVRKPGDHCLGDGGRGSGYGQAMGLSGEV